MAYAVGPISGGHFNPAVSLGLWAGGRFPGNGLLPYVVAQVAGGVAGAAILFVIASGQAGFDASAGFAANGYGEHSPGKYSLAAALVTEVVMTFGFLIVILGSTHHRAPVGFAGIAIGLALTLIHLVSIPVTNTSVNPARSTGAALFAGELGPGAAVAVLARADRRRAARGRAVPGAAQPERSELEPPVTGSRGRTRLAGDRVALRVRRSAGTCSGRCRKARRGGRGRPGRRRTRRRCGPSCSCPVSCRAPWRRRP